MDGNSSISDMAEKWQCSVCTYLNYQNSQKCVMCSYSKNNAYLLIEEAAGTSALEHRSVVNQVSSLSHNDRSHWSCPICTYSNCLKTKRCIQCYNQRPDVYDESDSGDLADQNVFSKTKFQLKSGGWDCLSCTYSNWPIAKRCALCFADKPVNNTSNKEPELMKNVHAISPSSSNSQQSATKTEYSSALDIYLRRYTSNDFREKLFFKAVNNMIGRDQIQVTNLVVEYLISEGNLQRALTCFEARLMNIMRVFQNIFERGDSLMHLAKKCNHSDLVKLIKRATYYEDKLPCSLNCSLRTQLFAKVTKLFSVRKFHVNSHHTTIQCIAQPYNFNIIDIGKVHNDLNHNIVDALFKPAPVIPPTFVPVECINYLDGNVVNRSLNYLMKNRGGSKSLCDSLFQAVFGVCDRFGILRTALKYTMERSPIFWERWIDQHLRMAKDVGISITSQDCETDWEDIINLIADDDEFLEPIHVWVLSHILCRPIVIFPYDELDIDELEKNNCFKPRQQYFHIFEGIYLPVLLNSHPTTRSPLLLAFHNGLFNAVIIDDSYHAQGLHQFVKLRKTNRRGDNPFRFLNQNELEDLDLIDKFIDLGPCTATEITIQMDHIPFLFETLLLYENWITTLNDKDTDLANQLSDIKLEKGLEQLVDSERQSKFNPMPKILSEEVDSILRVSSLELRRRSPVSVAETTSKNELEEFESDEEEDDDECYDT